MKGKFILVRVLPILLVMMALALAIPLSGVVADPSLAPVPPGVSANEKSVPNPDNFFGFKVGGDYNLVNYPESVNYFKAVAETSSRVKFEVIGQTSGTENFAPLTESPFPPQPMVMATISDKNNLDKLATYKAIQQKLADPRTLGPGEADKLIAQALPVVLIAPSQHASEIGGTQMVIKLLYDLATSDSPAVQEVLQNTILLLIPSQNPDGLRMETEWYRKYLADHPTWAGNGVPWLYQKYAGHDNNRDWFMFNLAENQASGKVLYQDWFPNVVYDVHQMGANGARIFVPPFTDPVNPEIDPLIIREISLIGDTAVTDLQSAGLHGVATNAIYDTWWHGGMRSAPYYHNMVGLLTEAASTNLATPIYQTNADIKGSVRGIADNRQAYNNYPDPYFPVENPDKTPNWHLSDIMQYEQITAMGFLKAAARNKETLVRNFYNLNVKGIEQGLPDPKPAGHYAFEGPFAYVLPADQQRDPATTAKLVNTMIFTGNEVHQATAPFNAGEVTYPAGSYVFLLSQPFRQNLTGTLGVQKYPPRFNANGTAEAPYDVAGWSLWMQMGTPLVEVAQPFDTGNLKKVKEAPIPAGVIGSGNATYGYAFGPEMNNAFIARLRLLDAKYSLDWAMAGFSVGTQSFAAGTTIVKAGPNLASTVASKAGPSLASTVASLANELGVSFYPLASAPSVTSKTLSKPRIAVYESWSGNADSAWLRCILDLYGIPYTVLHDPGDDPVDYWGITDASRKLGDFFDVVVLSNVSTSGLSGSNYPPEFTGGIGATVGQPKLIDFVNGGGTLLTSGSGGSFPMSYMGIKVSNGLQGVPSSAFYCPGSVLQVNVDNTDPVAFGFADKADIYFSGSPAYVVADGNPSNVKVLASYGDENTILRSGWLLDIGDTTKTPPVPSNLLQHKVAALEAPYGSGKVVMLGFFDHWRGQSWGPLKFDLNTFTYATAK